MEWEEFRNLDLAEIGSWPRPAKWLVWGLLSLLIIVPSYNLILRGQLQGLKSAQWNERQLKIEFENKWQVAARYRASSPAAGPGGQALLQNSMAGLLEKISQAGSANGVEFLLFQPQPEVKATQFTELPIRMRVAGNYHRFGRFVSELARLPRPISFHELHIERNRNGDSPLIMELVIKSYRPHATEGGAG